MGVCARKCPVWRRGTGQGVSSCSSPSCAATKKLMRSEALPPLLCSLLCFAVETTWFFFFSGPRRSTLMTLLRFSSTKGKKERESPHWILQAPSYLMRECVDHQGFSITGWGWNMNSAYPPASPLEVRMHSKGGTNESFRR